MKKVTMFMTASCPYCREALRMTDALYKEDAKYKAIEVEKIDENLHPDIAEQYDYYYVPTYYVGDRKLHEGATNPKVIKQVFDAALDE